MRGYRNISLIITVLLFIVALMISTTVPAHSPSDMELSYNKETGQLNVTISHSVDDKNTHHIEEIIINKNGDEYEKESYNSQPDNSKFTYTYDVDASEGDTINVKANCNQGGDIESTIEITEEGVKEKDDSPFIPFLIVIFLLAIMSFLYNKKYEL